MHLSLSPTERLLYRLLAQKAGKVVPYSEIEAVFCCKKGRYNLVMYIGRLRRKLEPLGFVISNHNRIGYKLDKPRKKAVETIPLTEEMQGYATAMESSIRGILSDHVEVGFESQVAILGVAIGAILYQLPAPDRDYCIKVLMVNVRHASDFSKALTIQ